MLGTDLMQLNQLDYSQMGQFKTDKFITGSGIAYRNHIQLRTQTETKRMRPA